MIRVINGQVTLVLANRQLVFGIVMLMLLMWLFAVVTYMVSQVASPTSVAAFEEFKEPVIFVDSPATSAVPGKVRITGKSIPARGRSLRH